MRLTINNEEVVCRAEVLADLIRELNMPEQGIAVAIDKRLVPRSSWCTTELYEGADIRIIKSVCGG